MRKKGIVLYLVLATIFIVIILANVVMLIILSHSKLTFHQTSRIQAHYALLAGMNLAFENLRMENWGTGSYALCPSADIGCTLTDADIPYRVDITIAASDARGIRNLTLTTNYTCTTCSP